MNPSVDIAWIKAAMCEYFNVKERSEMLTHLYVCVQTKPCAWICVKDRGRLSRHQCVAAWICVKDRGRLSRHQCVAAWICVKDRGRLSRHQCVASPHLHGGEGRVEIVWTVNTLPSRTHTHTHTHTVSLSARLPCRLPSALSAFPLPGTGCTRPQRYTTFDKSFYAGFALKVVEGAKLGDSICVRAFQKAGTDLGRHIVAVAPHITEPLRDAGLTVICTCFFSFRWASASFRFSTGPFILR